MPEPLVDLVEEDPRWAEQDIGAIADRSARAVLALVGRDPDRHQVSLLACDDARIAKLNADFRGQDKPTNVLSWPAFDGPVPEPGEEPVFLGDLALSYDTCAREAEASGLALGDHAAHLVVHGVLHLLGFDHEMEAEANAMEEIETKILATMGIADPYSREVRP